jgi:methylthioribose-1-phosphate isomerase
MVVEAIRYSRGSLQLLEQRRLPLETAWVEIPDVQAGWQAIRDMTVRGAPAIAIAAALSLAVELVRGGAGAQFAGAAEAAAACVALLDHLATR